MHVSTLHAFTSTDQGFDIADYIGVHGARLQTPSFMRGKRQLGFKEVVMSKKLSEVHVFTLSA